MNALADVVTVGEFKDFYGGKMLTNMWPRGFGSQTVPFNLEALMDKCKRWAQGSDKHPVSIPLNSCYISCLPD